jgi:hypothetical protein
MLVLNNRKGMAARPPRWSRHPSADPLADAYTNSERPVVEHQFLAGQKAEHAEAPTLPHENNLNNKVARGIVEAPKPIRNALNQLATGAPHLEIGNRRKSHSNDRRSRAQFE